MTQGQLRKSKPNVDGRLQIKALRLRRNTEHETGVATNVSSFFQWSVSLLILGFVLVAFPNYSNDSMSLSESYILCSPHEPKIYTVDAENTKVECIVVDGGFVVDSGKRGEIVDKWRGMYPFSLFNLPGWKNFRVSFLPANAVVVPGLSDSHAHIIEYGAWKELYLEDARSIPDAVQFVRRFIESTPDVMNNKSKVIEGWGWDHTKWPMSNLPTAEDLDSDPVVRGRPIILQSKDGHMIWVSRTLLETALPLPVHIEGGEILRSEDGSPIGVFLDKAKGLFTRPLPSHEDLLRRFETAVGDALAMGLTSVHDAGANPISAEFFHKLASQANLPIRIYAMRHFDQHEYVGKTEKVIDAGRLTIRSIKIFADGALRSGGAALYEPYADRADSRGFMTINPETLQDAIANYSRDGWQVNVHAIGDRCNGLVLDAFESIMEPERVAELRPRLEHAQIVAPEDMARIGKLGLVASVQPTHSISDMWYAEKRLGPDRVKNLYAFRSLTSHGAKLAFGSDFPVEDMNPIAGFYSAVSRLSYDGKSPHGADGWFPEERLTREEALRGLTINGAYASFSEEKLGSLEIGKVADYVVLSQDIMEVPMENILETQVLATVLDGKISYGHI